MTKMYNLPRPQPQLRLRGGMDFMRAGWEIQSWS